MLGRVGMDTRDVDDEGPPRTNEVEKEEEEDEEEEEDVPLSPPLHLPLRSLGFAEFGRLVVVIVLVDITSDSPLPPLLPPR